MSAANYAAELPSVDARVDYQTDPSRYRHWSLRFDGPIATLGMSVAEDGGIRPGYKLKLNSYDLGVDIELHDALNRIRFEHPEVGAVVVTSLRERIFCSGANIFMLGLSSHAWKVNFCKFTNETRNGIEDASRHSGLKFLAAVNGTGGLTRLVDKRKVRRDLADVFSTTSEGVRGERAKQWRLVDQIVKTTAFDERVRTRARELAEASDRPTATEARGVELTPLLRTIEDDRLQYEYVTVEIDHRRRHATLTVRSPRSRQPATIEGIVAAGAGWWPLAVARELDDAILSLRTNEPKIGTWLLRTDGDRDEVLDVDAALLEHENHWFVRETVGLLRRTLARLEVSSRTLFALIERGSCFAGTLLELALAADRSYMLSAEGGGAPSITITAANLGLYPPVGARSRLENRFHGEAEVLGALRAAAGQSLGAKPSLELGLVTSAPDEIDWGDEVRIAIEERASLSPDALTGMEANLRFSGETMESRIFGRLSAWQNWIFGRPNAVGDKGALKLYGKGEEAQFDWRRV